MIEITNAKVILEMQLACGCVQAIALDSAPANPYPVGRMMDAAKTTFLEVIPNLTHICTPKETQQ